MTNKHIDITRIESYIRATCNVLDFDVGELWCAKHSHSGGKLSLRFIHLYVSPAFEDFRSLLVRPDYNNQDEKKHRFSPLVCRGVCDGGQIVWANTKISDGLTGSSHMPLNTAVGVPICTIGNDIYLLVLFAVESIDMTATAVEYLLATGRAITVDPGGGFLPVANSKQVSAPETKDFVGVWDIPQLVKEYSNEIDFKFLPMGKVRKFYDCHEILLFCDLYHDFKIARDGGFTAKQLESLKDTLRTGTYVGRNRSDSMDSSCSNDWNIDKADASNFVITGGGDDENEGFGCGDEYVIGDLASRPNSPTLETTVDIIEANSNGTLLPATNCADVVIQSPVSGVQIISKVALNDLGEKIDDVSSSGANRSVVENSEARVSVGCVDVPYNSNSPGVHRNASGAMLSTDGGAAGGYTNSSKKPNKAGEVIEALKQIQKLQQQNGTTSTLEKSSSQASNMHSSQSQPTLARSSSQSYNMDSTVLHIYAHMSYKVSQCRFHEFMIATLGMTVFDCSELWLLSDKEGEIYLASGVFRNKVMQKWLALSEHLRLRIGHDVPGKVVKTNNYVWEPNYQENYLKHAPEVGVRRTAGIEYGVQTAFGVPLPGLRGSCGAMVFYSSQSNVALDPLMVQLMEQAIRIITNAAMKPDTYAHVDNSGNKVNFSKKLLTHVPTSSHCTYQRRLDILRTNSNASLLGYNSSTNSLTGIVASTSSNGTIAKDTKSTDRNECSEEFKVDTTTKNEVSGLNLVKKPNDFEKRLQLCRSIIMNKHSNDGVIHTEDSNKEKGVSSADTTVDSVDGGTNYNAPLSHSFDSGDNNKKLQIPLERPASVDTMEGNTSRDESASNLKKDYSNGSLSQTAALHDAFFAYKQNLSAAMYQQGSSAASDMFTAKISQLNAANLAVLNQAAMSALAAAANGNNIDALNKTSSLENLTCLPCYPAGYGGFQANSSSFRYDANLEIQKQQIQQNIPSVGINELGGSSNNLDDSVHSDYNPVVASEILARMTGSQPSTLSMLNHAGSETDTLPNANVVNAAVALANFGKFHWSNFLPGSGNDSMHSQYVIAAANSNQPEPLGTVERTEKRKRKPSAAASSALEAGYSIGFLGQENSSGISSKNFVNGSVGNKTSRKSTEQISPHFDSSFGQRYNHSTNSSYEGSTADTFNSGNRPSGQLSTGSKCRIDDCRNMVDSAGSQYCSSHRGTRRCQVDGCSKCAQGATKFCIAHGGGRRCTYPGCFKGARDKFFCAAHGGGKRCNFEGCTKSAVGGSNLCTAHGGGRRCLYDGCNKSAQSSTNYCVKHGGGRTCMHDGCNKVARGKTEYCAAHGGGVRCKIKNCHRIAVGNMQLCRTHGGVEVL